jgi:hypothetical protein
MKKIPALIALALATASLNAAALSPKELQQSIRAIKSVGAEGKGNLQAGQAWQKLSQAQGKEIVTILKAMDGSSSLAANWLRGAVHSIADRELNAGRALPIADLEKYLKQTEHNPRARRFAFDLIARTDQTKADRIIPKMINDPSVELRRDAVQLVLDAAKKQKAGGNEAAAAKSFGRALNYARDVNQIQTAVAALRAYGKMVDVPKQFGFLMDWQVIGPFDNSEREGFVKVYPPEKEIKLKARYEGKDGKVNWQSFTSEDEYGKVDMNLPYGMLKEVASYAYAEYEAAESRSAELRLGGKNAWKVWVNGKFIFGRDEYHRGKRIDQYTLPINLMKGQNTILVKVCQDGQEQTWTKEWDFQVRISDSTGAAILAQNRKPTAAAALNPPSKK